MGHSYNTTPWDIRLGAGTLGTTEPSVPTHWSPARRERERGREKRQKRREKRRKGQLSPEGRAFDSEHLEIHLAALVRWGLSRAGLEVVGLALEV